MIYRSRGEHFNHYTTDVASCYMYLDTKQSHLNEQIKRYTNIYPKVTRCKRHGKIKIESG